MYFKPLSSLLSILAILGSSCQSHLKLETEDKAIYTFKSNAPFRKSLEHDPVYPNDSYYGQRKKNEAMILTFETPYAPYNPLKKIVYHFQFGFLWYDRGLGSMEKFISAIKKEKFEVKRKEGTQYANMAPTDDYGHLRIAGYSCAGPYSLDISRTDTFSVECITKITTHLVKLANNNGGSFIDWEPD